jgi:hypothetical protein
MKLSPAQVHALNYVDATQGVSTLEDFQRDLDTDGTELWDGLVAAGLVAVDDQGIIGLTEEGHDTCEDIPF